MFEGGEVFAGARPLVVVAVVNSCKVNPKVVHQAGWSVEVSGNGQRLCFGWRQLTSTSTLRRDNPKLTLTLTD